MTRTRTWSVKWAEAEEGREGGRRPWPSHCVMYPTHLLLLLGHWHLLPSLTPALPLASWRIILFVIHWCDKTYLISPVHDCVEQVMVGRVVWPEPMAGPDWAGRLRPYGALSPPARVAVASTSACMHHQYLQQARLTTLLGSCKMLPMLLSCELEPPTTSGVMVMLGLSFVCYCVSWCCCVCQNILMPFMMVMYKLW